MAQALNQWNDLPRTRSISTIELPFLPGDLHELAKIVLPVMQKTAHPTVQLKYLADQFKFAQLPVIVEFGLALGALQAGGVEQPLRLEREDAIPVSVLRTLQHAAGLFEQSFVGSDHLCLQHI